ncbi:MAG: acyltransferase [Coriobacteriales bacterium]|nr:acyltransferase [Coriobacteriales bacterium]
MRQRLHNLDLLKTLAMLMVVIIHAVRLVADVVQYPTIGNYCSLTLRLLCEGVPIFLLVNGFLLFGKQTFDLSAHLRKTGKLFALLVIWSIILIGIQYPLHAVLYGTPIDITEMFELFLDTKVNSLYSGTLWYLQALVAVYLLFPLFKCAYDTDGRLFEYLFVVAAVCAGIPALISMASFLPVSETAMSFISKTQAWFGQMIPFAGSEFLFYFLLGGMIRKYSAKLELQKNRWTMIGAGAFVLSVFWTISMGFLGGSVPVFNVNYWGIFEPFIIIGWYCLTLRYHGTPEIAQRITTSVGSLTLGIYLVHPLVIAAFTAIPLPSMQIVMLIVALIVFLVSWGITALSMRIPGIRWIFRV